MCGIAGILSWSERFPIQREVLEAMSARIAHRGPDAQGIWISAADAPSSQHPRVGFVHRRLAILDLDPRANQPYFDEDGRAITFNGEIYNFHELRRELETLLPGRAWRTTSDTEVLLAAWQAWGVECVGHLNGMFAFGIWDAQQQTLFLARDRMGQKPLYIAHDPNGVIAFASELPALRELKWIDTALDPTALAEYLTWGWVTKGTIFRGITKLPPGSYLVLRDGRIDQHTYFNPNPLPSPVPLDEAVSSTRQLVTRAVQRQLVSDVPLGCFLSGGIDSSIIASAMRAIVPRDQPVLTFSIGFDDARYDETPYAAEVAKHLGTQHRQFTVRPNAAEDLPRLAAAFGEPLADSSALPTHYLSRETRQHVKVALSGDGGDELFGGYDRYRAMALSPALRTCLRLLAPLRWLPGSHPKSRLARLKRLLATINQPDAQRYASYLELFDPAMTAALLSRADVAMHAERQLVDRFEQLQRVSRSGQHGCPRDAVQAAAALDRELYLPEDLLVKVDRCSMLHALEVRSPFMDHELVHFAATLPTDLLLGGGSKRLLRAAFAADLPRTVFHRPKMGFAVPIGEWFRTDLRNLLHDALFASNSFTAVHFQRPAIERLVQDHESGRADHSQRLYALLMLELWHRL